MDRPFDKSDFDRIAARGRKRAPKLSSDIPLDPVAFVEKYATHPLSPAWRATIKAAYGLAFDDADRGAFASVAGGVKPSAAGYEEIAVIAGRGGGKTEHAALLVAFEGLCRGAEHMRKLPSGTPGYVMLLARVVRQASVAYKYIAALIERHPELASLVESMSEAAWGGGELKLHNGVHVAVFPMSKASIRGYRVIAAVSDEIGWWETGQDSAQQDTEVLSALRGCMTPPAGAPSRKLFVISSPGPKLGYLWGMFESGFGKSLDSTLVVRGTSMQWNPSLDEAWLAREKARDLKNFAREYGGEFVDSVSSGIGAETITPACAGRSAEPMPPVPGVQYVASADFAFRRDRCVLALGFLEPAAKGLPPKFVVASCFRWTPTPGNPLDSGKVVSAMASILSTYGVDRILCDQYSSAPLASDFRAHGIRFKELTATSASKLEHYSALREAFYAGRVSLPNDEMIISEFLELEERVTAGGNVQIGHPNRGNAHDDHASAICWLFAATKIFPPLWGSSSSYSSPMSEADRGPERTPTNCVDFV